MSKGKTGQDWTYKIFFYPEADKSDGGKKKAISDEELIEKMADLIDADEDIEEVTAYKSALTSFQLTKFLFYHMFVVFGTRKWWWSIEKNSEGITLQRSKKWEAVKNRYRQEDRLQQWSIESVKKDSGRKNMKGLIHMLWKENELNHRYSFLDSNCKHFAKVVFDFVAENKYL